MHEFNKLHPDFAGIRFVSLALSKSLNQGESLTFLHVQADGLTIEASDGHRCHQYTLTNPLKPGLYKVIVNKKTEIIIAPSDCGLTFPDTSMVIPSKNLEFIDLANGNLPALDYARIIRAMGAGAIQYNFFLDAVSVYMQEFSVAGPEKPVLFKGPNSLALVMPLRDKKA